METLGLDTDQLVALCRRNDAAFVGLFGSFARGEATEDSDVDLLVRFSRRKSLLDLIRIEREMSNALERSVDLLTEASISPYLRERIEQETIVLYDESA